ncbi:MAG TPA: hypothetical protein VK963_02595, partial [Candidatus Saccharimonadales bacterium]|nr:hypothetical protein [Candidatus Saccharimonadales bacterium]
MSRLERAEALKRAVIFYVIAIMVGLNVGAGTAEAFFGLFESKLELKPLEASSALKDTPAADARTKDAPAPKLVAPDSPQDKPEPLMQKDDKPRKRIKELTGEFTPRDKVWLNDDGTKTVEHSMDVKNYNDGGTWRPVDRSLEQVSLLPVAWQSKANAWRATFQPLGKGGVSVSDGASTMRFEPSNQNLVREVIPEVSGKAPDQIVTYREVWPGVDIEYQVYGADLKETIIIKRPGAQTDFSFQATGAKLVADPERQGWFKVLGAAGEVFTIAAPTVATVTEGVVGAQPYVRQTADGSRLDVKLDKSWFERQPLGAFPVRIDPSTMYTSYSGPNNWYRNYKSDGFVCDPGMGCGNSTGSVSNNFWRFMYHVDFDRVAGKY